MRANKEKEWDMYVLVGRDFVFFSFLSQRNTNKATANHYISLEPV